MAILTVDQVAKKTGAGRSTIYDLVSKNQIPHFKLGSAIRFREETIDAWIAAQEGQVKPAGRREIPAYETAMGR